ncbi:MAG: hypothetical protein E7443_01105 [Ruminococcaceae bacterium]|nr:hypothetical protein [Oscillospiraceae bacterium]
MKNKWVWFLWTVAYAAAFTANLGYFWWSWDVGALQVLASTLYLAVCVLLFYRKRKNVFCMRWAVRLSVLTVAAGVLGLLVRVGGPEVSFLMLPALLLAGAFVTPLYGLLGFFPDFDLCYAAAAALGAAWFLWALYLKRSITRKNLT